MTKICNVCKIEKLISDFCKHPKCKDGLTNICKTCKTLRDKQRYENNKSIILSKNQQYRKQHKVEIAVIARNYYEQHKEKIKVRVKHYRQSNRDKINNKKYHKKYREKYAENFKCYQQHYKKQKRKNDPSFKMRCNLSSRINKAIKCGHKAEKLVDLLGCSINELKNYLESKFTEGMTWDNYNCKGWHIDHIIPCAVFDLTIPLQQKECFHYSNLQPLWAKDNLRKNKY